jgi:hypothetical protein
MKKLIAAVAGAVMLSSVPASATHTGLYSKATPHCVPPIVALYWYNPAYAAVFLKVRNAKIKHGLGVEWKDRTPACWMGVASKALGIKHKKLYTPAESRRIREWFAARTAIKVSN